jgi:hypothetical protein
LGRQRFRRHLHRHRHPLHAPITIIITITVGNNEGYVSRWEASVQGLPTPGVPFRLSLLPFSVAIANGATGRGSATTPLIA